METGESRLRKEIHTELNNLSRLTPSQLDRMNQDIKEMIKYYGGLTDHVEERRTRHFEFSIQYALLLVTAAGYLWTVKDNLGEINICRIFLIFAPQLGFAVASIILFVFQSMFIFPFGKFKDLGNQWKWFYYGNPPVMRISTRPILPESSPEQTTIPYLEGLKQFVQAYMEEDRQSEIKSNLIQLYLLQVHNYYKNRFYLQLYSLTRWSIFVSAAMILLLIVVAII